MTLSIRGLGFQIPPVVPQLWTGEDVSWGTGLAIAVVGLEFRRPAFLPEDC